MTKAILAVAAVLAAALSLTGLELKGNGPDVFWQTQKVEVSVAQDGRASADLNFIVNRDLDDVSIRVVPELEQYVIVTPNYFDSINKGSLVKLQVVFAIPKDLAVGTYTGTIQIKAANRGEKQQRTFAKPLPVTVVVTEPPAPSPQRFELSNDDGTAEAFDFNHSLGRAASFAKFTASGQGPLKIVGAKFYLKPTGSPASSVDVYAWDINKNSMMGTPMQFTPDGSGEGWYTFDLSSQNLTTSDEFYLGISWPDISAPALLGVDLSSPQGRSYVVVVDSNMFIPVANSNMMIRAIVEKPL